MKSLWICSLFPKSHVPDTGPSSSICLEIQEALTLSSFPHKGKEFSVQPVPSSPNSCVRARIYLHIQNTFINVLHVILYFKA